MYFGTVIFLQHRFKSIEKNKEEIVIETVSLVFVLTAAPAKLELFHSYDKKVPALIVNDMGRLVMEYNRKEQNSELVRNPRKRTNPL